MVDRNTFQRFLQAQKDGKYNMITESTNVIEEYNIPRGAYFEILSKYDELYSKFIKNWNKSK